MSEEHKLLLADFFVYLDMEAEQRGIASKELTGFLSDSLNKFVEERHE